MSNRLFPIVLVAIFMSFLGENAFAINVTLDISFSAADKTVYYDDAASSLTWDDVRSYLYLPYGTEKNIFKDQYPVTMPTITPQKPTIQMGCSLVILDDCYVRGFARFAGPNGGNPTVRLWTNDSEEKPGGITNPWVDMSVGNTAGWVERLIDFSEDLYPLTAGNTYWLANVADGIDGHLVGNAGAANSGCNYVSISEIAGQPQLWYINNDETAPGSSGDPSENLNVIPQLQGVSDMRLNRFNSAGALITKSIDLGATKVEINDFLAAFQTSNAKTGFDAVSKTDVMTYSIKYDMISALNRIPECEAAFSIAQSTGGDTFGDYETSFAGIINKRHIKIKMDLTTGHRGITPIVDSVSIAYNCYPEPIDALSVSPADGDLVTEKSPVFSWEPSYDHDGDTVTYTLSLSATPSFDPLIFSSGAVSVPASTYVAVNCPVELDDKTTYYFRIDATDSNGALTGYDRTFSFKTTSFVKIPQAPTEININPPAGETQIKDNDTIVITGNAEAGTTCGIVIKDQNGKTLTSGITTANLSVGLDGLINAQVSLGKITQNYPLATKIQVEIFLRDPAGNISTTASSSFVVFKAEKEEVKLYDNLMNPADGKPVTIRYELPSASLVTIQVYNRNGTLIKKIIDNQSMGAGVYTAEWLGKNTGGNIVASGVYVIHVKTDSYSKILKAVVVK